EERQGVEPENGAGAPSGQAEGLAPAVRAPPRTIACSDTGYHSNPPPPEKGPAPGNRLGRWAQVRLYGRIPAFDVPVRPVPDGPGGAVAAQPPGPGEKALADDPA